MDEIVLEMKMDYFKFGLFTLWYLLVVLLNQTLTVPLVLNFYLYGLPLILGFILGGKEDSLEKVDLTLDELKQLRRKELIYKTAGALVLTGTLGFFAFSVA
ncbi:hypothetical protein K6Y31_02390 [Motilimonas cestriensis]|uniref:Uncharacterized protein n=1 Tax=Motilimonas cestriensis TaxID=2742685 RepID=A0ABS8W7D2_9GAMM|nr:hypothetical protein [Motilimonas cestriensis]MCE2593661.1 hypothetical protein [Motilimonas cestriensis]